MNSIRLKPEQESLPYRLMTRRMGTEDREPTFEISCHATRREALDALYEHIALMAGKGFFCERESLLRWKARRIDPDKVIECVVYVFQAAY